jgi:hypothetical protein
MSATRPFLYRFNRYEPALLIEIYLPKKIRYQGALYRCLRTGFNFTEVQKHLTMRSHFPHIREFLEDYPRLYSYYKDNDIEAIKARVKRMRPCFEGYSMYEVDGVFFNKDDFYRPANRKPFTSFIVEERVQVIRIIFRPQVNQLVAGLGLHRNQNPDKFDRLVRFATRTLVSEYEARSDLQHDDKDKKHIFDRMTEWVDDTALFLFGFMIYKICQEITDLQTERERPEDEIWVTSFWEFNINRITRRE